MVTMLNNVDQLNIFSLADKILVLKLELAKVSWELPLEIPLLSLKVFILRGKALPESPSDS